MGGHLHFLKNVSDLKARVFDAVQQKCTNTVYPSFVEVCQLANLYVGTAFADSTNSKLQS